MPTARGTVRLAFQFLAKEATSRMRDVLLIRRAVDQGHEPATAAHMMHGSVEAYTSGGAGRGVPLPLRWFFNTPGSWQRGGMSNPLNMPHRCFLFSLQMQA